MRSGKNPLKRTKDTGLRSQQTDSDPEGKKEEAKMMNNMMIHNMANVMAEDTGLFELRSPEISGMRTKGWVSRLISMIRRH